MHPDILFEKSDFFSDLKESWVSYHKSSEKISGRTLEITFQGAD